LWTLGANPDDPTLDIKPLQGQPYYRLRVGDWRIIYDREDEVKIIAIEKIKPRGGGIQMSLQIIKSIDGKDEYVLLPINIYNALRDQIKERMKKIKSKANYVAFDPADYVDNPIALARIKFGITQEELAERMNVTQAYISKIETQDKVTAKMLQKVKSALEKK